MKTALTDTQRRVLESAGRRHYRPATEADDKDCRDLANRKLLKAHKTKVTSIYVGETVETMYRITKAGKRVLDGEAAHPESERAKERRQWAADTVKAIKAGKRCEWPGCTSRVDHGHHRRKARTGDFSKANRRDLCETHHRLAEREFSLAASLDISASAHDPIEPPTNRTFPEFR